MPRRKVYAGNHIHGVMAGISAQCGTAASIGCTSSPAATHAATPASDGYRHSFASASLAATAARQLSMKSAR